MAKKIIIPCSTHNGVLPVEFQVGVPAKGNQPIDFQSKWLTSTNRGSIPTHILKAISDLYQVSLESNIDFAELCKNAFDEYKENYSNNTTASGSDNNDDDIDYTKEY